MKPLIRIFILLIIGIFIALYIIRSNERVNNTNATVYINKSNGKYELYRNGKPFYIQGASGNSHFQELKNAGANTLRVYDTINLDHTLRTCDSLGLAVIVDLVLPKFKGNESYYQDINTRNEIKSTILSTVKKYKNYPALLMWNFNEIEYPHQRRFKYFRTFFGSLIDEIHEFDTNHPISTSITGLTKIQMASLQYWCPQLDLIAINIFGGINKLEKELNRIKPIWNGAYYLSEWGNNGPWEESDKTIWNAPIEKTSTLKALEIRERYKKLIPKKNDRFLGNLAFYWGNKQERTHTWFSMFSENGDRTQSIEELEYIWSKKRPINSAPEIDSIKLNNKNPGNNILLKSGDIIESTIFFSDKENDSLTIKWELFPENWNYFFGFKENKPNVIEDAVLKQIEGKIKLRIPEKEGPYRLFSYVYDKHGNFATANIPFYVLNTTTR
ncbi:hypothetical protein [Urechidicola croceus]|uniref:Glycoside hydrolase family 2 catalytic domain-containing protein n=1 Tax=Urechidicola croceus TaxID=1850246 RepID=A0A1D8PAY1_9FLAO|nr:hypothetical protein [Urechidicola croceus]AOW21715.1 hypothetical protein LPB138_13940 [Urechidicola croceus]